MPNPTGVNAPTYTTDNKAVNNNIALAAAFLPILDEVYKVSARTSILDFANERVRFIGGNTVSLYRTTMNGLGNYNRNQGFLTGDVNGSWENMTLTQDRGRSFLVDVMDNEESLGMAFGTLAGEFTRLHTVPEVDAYRFAKYASTPGISQGTPADLTAALGMPNLISEAEYVLSEAEVPEEGRILFTSENAYRYLKDGVTRIVTNDERGINHAIEYFDDMRVVRVPQARFYTAITLLDGITSGQEIGGFTPAAGAYPINFMIIHPSAVVQVLKHLEPRIFSPEVNQSADAWLYQYRIYHDAFVEENKAVGIYLHRAATAV